MDNAIDDFIKCRRIAVAGVSRSGKKFGNTAFSELKKRGYEVYAVNPSAAEISGIKCYPNLSALKGIVDALFISVSPKKVPPLLQEAAEIGVRNIWLQKGAESPEALAAAKDLGLNSVSGKCILMYAPPVKSIHAFHRAIMKFFGKL